MRGNQSPSVPALNTPEGDADQLLALSVLYTENACKDLPEVTREDRNRTYNLSGWSELFPLQSCAHWVQERKSCVYPHSAPTALMHYPAHPTSLPAIPAILLHFTGVPGLINSQVQYQDSELRHNLRTCFNCHDLWLWGHLDQSTSLLPEKICSYYFPPPKQWSHAVCFSSPCCNTSMNNIQGAENKQAHCARG